MAWLNTWKLKKHKIALLNNLIEIIKWDYTKYSPIFLPFKVGGKYICTYYDVGEYRMILEFKFMFPAWMLYRDDDKHL